jgi:hypothetical protein
MPKKKKNKSPPQAHVRPPSSTQAEATNHFAAFFASYPSFNYNLRAPAWQEFDLLVRHMGWERRSAAYRDARTDFRRAMVMDFNSRFGTDEQRLEAWQNICNILGIQPVPESITQCRKASTFQI